MRLANRLLVAFSSLGYSAAAFAQNIGFFDIRLVDRDEIETIEFREPLTIVKEPEVLLDPITAPRSKPKRIPTSWPIT